MCEGEVELGSSLPASAEATLVVEPGVGAFDRPAVACMTVADAAGAGLPFARDMWGDAALLQCLAEPVGVVAAVGEQPGRPVLAAAATGAQPRHRVHGRERVHAVVPVSRPQQERERDAAAVTDRVQLRRGAAPVYRAFAGRGAPFLASTIVESSIARCQSILPSLANRPCSRS